MKNLRQNRLKFNIKKSLFGKNKMEYMGFWVTQRKIRLVNKKVEAIVNMKPSINQKQVSSFIVLVS